MVLDDLVVERTARQSGDKRTIEIAEKKECEGKEEHVTGRKMKFK